MYCTIFEFTDPTDKLWRISVDTIFTTFTTIFIFICGYLIKLFIEFKNNKSKDNELKKYYLYISKLYIDPIDDLLNEAREIADKIGSTDHKNIHFKCPNGLNFDQITEIHQLDLYRIFIEKDKNPLNHKTQNYKIFVDSYLLLKKTIPSLEVHVNNYVNTANRYIKTWDDNINQIMRFIESIVPEITSEEYNPQTHMFLNGINIVTSRWLELDNFREMTIAIKNFIDPLNELCNKYHDNKRVLVITPMIAECQRAYKNMMNLKSFYKNIFYDIGNDIDDILKKLKRAINFFEK